ncbi:C-type lectin domain family 2 member D-like [Ambystoma mexicanum]|uniref:C-type lectin domain family 2 member D-like n=1 Tax=Ambystoma mexicanum TaxID=8296 RepID=UPI0037E7B7F1
MNQPEGRPIPGHSPTHGGANPRRKKGSLQRDSGGNSPGRLRENLSTAGPLQSGSGDPGPPRAPLSPEARRTINTKPGCPPSPQRRSVAENQEERHLLATKSADNENEEGKRQRTFPNVGSLKELCIRNVILWKAAIAVVVVLILAPTLALLSAGKPCLCAATPCPKAPCPDDGWIWCKGKCFYFSEDKKDWKSSWDFCSANGAALAILKDPVLLKTIIRYKDSRENYWIGLHKIWLTGHHNWTWVDGSPFQNETKLIESEGPKLYCAYLNSGTAGNLDCTTPRPWICVKEAS